MGLIAEFRMRSEDLPLVDVAAAAPGVTFQLESARADSAGRPTFAVRAGGDDLAGVEDAFAAAESVTDATLIVDEGERRQYQCRPLGGPPEDVETLLDNKSVAAEVRITPEGWAQRRRFADRQEFDAFRSFCRENDVDFRLDRLVETDGEGAAEGSVGDPGPEPLDGMTAAQREALVTAHEMGYFDVPRAATLAEVAAELDVAAASLSERLRRAQSHLVGQFRQTGIKPRTN